MRGPTAFASRVLAPVVLVAMVAMVAMVGVTVATGTAGAASSSSAPGIGSSAAKKNPMCDPETGQIKYPTFAAPPCVVTWKDAADNGGTTAQGVTADSIKVVVLYVDVQEDARSSKALYSNQATGQFSNQQDTILDSAKVYEHGYETWGRTVEYVFVEATGADEAAQRADAVKVAAMKPFAVFDAAVQGGNQSAGGLVFETAVQQAGVPLVLGAAGAIPQSPTDSSKTFAKIAASFAASMLRGKKAEYGGDDVKGRTRVFGLLYQGGQDGFDVDFFRSQYVAAGGTANEIEEIPLDYPAGTPQGQTSALAQQQAGTLMAKAKTDGVTTVLNLLDGRNGVGAFTKAATDQQFTPEWVPIAFTSDLDILARSYDQTQWVHAFGPVWFVPNVPAGTTVNPFDWYWGTNQGSEWSGAMAMNGALFRRLHVAGPDLTAAKMKPGGLPGATPGGGYYDNSVTTAATGPEQKDGTAIRDFALAWWSPDTVAMSQSATGSGTGAYLYLDGAKRYIAGKLPRQAAFFQPGTPNLLAEFTTAPAWDTPAPNFACDDCPATGNTAVTPAAAS